MKTIVIIDGYSTGKELITVLSEKSRDTQFIHIITPTRVSYATKSGYYSVPTNNPLYTKEYLYDNFADLLSFLAAWKINDVVCGAEGEGVTLREQLVHHYGLSTNNDFDLIECRRDKFAMGEQLRIKKLDHIQQYLISTKAELQNALTTMAKFPVVLKPRSSCSADGFFLCQNEAEAEKAFISLINNHNAFGEKNEAILLQEYVKGKEYAVNTVSWQGQHFITDIWSYELLIMEGGQRLNLSSTLEKNDDEALNQYTKDCLNALGFAYGAAHTEIMKVNNKYIMIESGCRLMGGGLSSKILAECITTTQIEALTISLTKPDELEKRAFGAKKSIKLVNILNCDASGYLHAFNNLDEITTLPSYQDINILVKPGQLINKATQRTDSLAHITLIHEDPEQVNKDYQKIRNIQKTVFLIIPMEP